MINPKDYEGISEKADDLYDIFETSTLSIIINSLLEEEEIMEYHLRNKVIKGAIAEGIPNPVLYTERGIEKSLLEGIILERKEGNLRYFSLSDDAKHDLALIE